VAGYAWDFGDGSTGSGVSASHSYAAAGTYSVALTVTDDRGATGTTTRSVTVQAPNVAPSASFTAVVSGLAVSVDGSGSKDSDGTVAGYAWNFGDGSTGTGVSASHSYAAAGTYTVTLVVTDDDGATGTATRSVSVAGGPAAPVELATDGFGRETSGGWGMADVGGAWAITGGAGNAAVTGGTGVLTVAAGKNVGAALPVSAQDVAAQVDVALRQPASGGGTYVNLAVRRMGTSDYRARLWFTAKGSVQLSVSRVVSGTETVLKTVTLPGTYTAGQVLRVRLDAAGSGTTTLQAKAWAVSGAEPADWQVSATDATAALQAAGGLYVLGYASGSSTATQAVVVDGLHLGAAGTTPAAG
jgi:PKD repeat protein